MNQLFEERPYGSRVVFHYYVLPLKCGAMQSAPRRTVSKKNNEEAMASSFPWDIPGKILSYKSFSCQTYLGRSVAIYCLSLEPLLRAIPNSEGGRRI